MSLLRAKTVTFTSFAEGYYDDDGLYFDGNEASFDVKGSLQPFEGMSRSILPEGVSTEDVRVFYTKDEILTANQLDNTQAYEADIGGFTFVVTMASPWIDSGVSLNHHRVILIRKDKNENEDQWTND